MCCISLKWDGARRKSFKSAHWRVPFPPQLTTQRSPVWEQVLDRGQARTLKRACVYTALFLFLVPVPSTQVICTLKRQQNRVIKNINSGTRQPGSKPQFPVYYIYSPEQVTWPFMLQFPHLRRGILPLTGSLGRLKEKHMLMYLKQWWAHSSSSMRVSCYYCLTIYTRNFGKWATEQPKKFSFM